MNKREAERLARKIGRTPGVQVTGMRKYGPGAYALDCVDTRSGYPFVIHNAENWEEHQRAADALDGFGE